MESFNNKGLTPIVIILIMVGVLLIAASIFLILQYRSYIKLINECQFEPKIVFNISSKTDISLVNQFVSSISMTPGVASVEFESSEDLFKEKYRNEQITENPLSSRINVVIEKQVIFEVQELTKKIKEEANKVNIVFEHESINFSPSYKKITFIDYLKGKLLSEFLSSSCYYNGFPIWPISQQ